MKKLLLLIAVFFVSCITTTEESKISSDSLSSEGRIITCYDERVWNDGLRDFDFSLTAISKSDSEVSYILKIGVVDIQPYEIWRGNVLLLKTVNDEIIKLHSRDFFDSFKTNYTRKGDKIYVANAEYIIKESDLLKLCKGVKKIRQERGTKGRWHEMVYKKDNMGWKLHNQVEAINKALKEEKTIYVNF